MPQLLFQPIMTLKLNVMSINLVVQLRVEEDVLLSQIVLLQLLNQHVIMLQVNQRINVLGITVNAEIKDVKILHILVMQNVKMLLPKLIVLLV